MKLKITSIQFDFDDDYGDFTESDFTEEENELSQEYKDNLVESVIGKVYEVEDEDEIADVISDETGWCVLSLDYELVK